MGQKTDKILKRAKVNLQKDNYENALRLFNEVLNREPSHNEALRNKALIKLINADKKEAKRFLLFAIEQQPEDDQLYQMLGAFHHNNEAPKKALSNLKKSIEINKDNELAHKGLGMLYAHFLNDHNNAVHHFDKAIALGQHSAEIYFNRGCSHMILQNMEKAEKDLREASRLGSSQAREMLQKYFGGN